MVSEDTRAILGSDLSKIFTAVVAFLLAYILIPVIYPSLFRIADLEAIPVTDVPFSTFFTVFGIVLLFLLWTIILFFGLFKFTSWLNKRFGVKIKRSPNQEKVRVLLVIIGFFMAAFLVYAFYFQPLIESFEIWLAFDLLQIVFWAFSTLSVTIIVVVVTFLKVIYGLVFLNDIIFHLYRKIHRTPLEYVERTGQRRHYYYLKAATIILIATVLVFSALIYVVRPTTFRFQEGEGVNITYVGSSIPPDPAVQVNYLKIYTSLVPAGVWEQADYLGTLGVDDPIDVVVYVLLIMDDVSNLNQKQYLNHIPQGRNIVGFILGLTVEGVSLEAIYYPSADEQNTECGFLSKLITIAQIEIVFSMSGPTGFSFKATITEQFHLEDLLSIF